MAGFMYCAIGETAGRTDPATGIVLVVDGDELVWTYGTDIRSPHQEHPSGLLCRDLAAAGARYFDALWYWFEEDRPARMDADGNGVPCETVYTADQINAVYTNCDV